MDDTDKYLEGLIDTAQKKSPKAPSHLVHMSPHATEEVVKRNAARRVPQQGCCHRFIKWCVKSQAYLYNLILGFLGLSFFVLSVYLFSIQDEVTETIAKFSQGSNSTPAMVCCFLALAFILVATIGFMGVKKHNKCILGLYLLVMGTLFIGTLALTAFAGFTGFYTEPETSFKVLVRDLPDTICAVQEQLNCSGWEFSCPEVKANVSDADESSDVADDLDDDEVAAAKMVTLDLGNTSNSTDTNSSTSNTSNDATGSTNSSDNSSDTGANTAYGLVCPVGCQFNALTNPCQPIITSYLDKFSLWALVGCAGIAAFVLIGVLLALYLFKLPPDEEEEYLEL